MIPLKRILCPVDTSEFSKHALTHAVAIGRWYGAKVTALTVRPMLLPPALWVEYPVALPFETSQDRLITLRAIREFVTDAVGAGVDDVVVRDGFVVPDILRVVLDLPADLIVMGTHGLSGFEHFILGSVTENVLRQASCPVLTIPPLDPGRSASGPIFNTILCAIDFSRDSQHALEYALSLAQESGGRLLLMHALEQFGAGEPRFSGHFNVSDYRASIERDTREQLHALVVDVGGTASSVELIVGHGRAHREILRVAAERSADVIVVGVHGRNALDLTLFGSTTHRILHHGSVPVLTVPRELKTSSAEDQRFSRRAGAPT